MARGPYDFYEEPEYAREAIDGIIVDLCTALGLDRKKVNRLTILEGQILVELKVTVKVDSYPPHEGIEVRAFEYDPPK